MDNIDACALFSGAKTIPFLKNGYEMFKKTFPKMPHQCPLLPGNFSAIDIKLVESEKDDMSKTAKQNQEKSMGIIGEVLRSVTPILPNGFYKYVCHVGTELEEVAASISFVFQLQYRMGEDNFK